MPTDTIYVDPRRLDRISTLIADLKNLAAPAQSTTSRWPLKGVEAVQNQLICTWLQNFSHFITDETVWTSMSTQINVKGKQLLDWIKQAESVSILSNTKGLVTNFVANEEYLIYEYGYTTSITPTINRIDPHVRRLSAPIMWNGADVMKFKDGRLVTIQHYSDSIGLPMQLGFMKNVKIGHDEAPVSPGLDGRYTSREISDAQKFGAFFGGISVGSGNTERARRNIENCRGIHEAFVNDRSSDFDRLIGPGSVWIDAPTRTILDGALAAAHHDHSNWSRAFTNNGATVHNIISNDDWSIVQHRGDGTHLGDLELGGQIFKPTGKKVSIYVLDCVKMGQDGKASLIRNYYDVGSMMFQLGVIDSFLISPANN